MTGESFTVFVFVIVGCVLIWGLWRQLFTVRIIDSTPRAASGTVTPAFLERVREVVATNRMSQGTIIGYAYGRFIRLTFSSEFTEPARQQLRNWWATFGWAAPKCRVSRC